MNVKPVFDAEPSVDLNITPTDIATELRRANPARVVYQPAGEWVEVNFGRQVFMFPPDLPGHPLVAHPALRDRDGRPVMVPADGTLEIRDNFGPELDTKTRVFLRGMRPVKGEAADDFLRFLAQTPKYRAAGFTWIRGDGQDEARKKAAQKIYAVARRRWAEQEIQARAEAIANFKKLPQNQGQVPPPPTANQMEAQEFLDEMKASGRQGSEFICEHGCYETNDFAKYQRHMLVNHKEAVSQETPVVPAEPVKRSPGRPKKAEAVA